MRRKHNGGYAMLLGLLLVVAIIALLYFMRPGAPAGSTPTKVGQSSIEQDLGALQAAKDIQGVAAQHAANTNAEMQ